MAGKLLKVFRPASLPASLTTTYLLITHIFKHVIYATGKYTRQAVVITARLILAYQTATLSPPLNPWPMNHNPLPLTY